MTDTTPEILPFVGIYNSCDKSNNDINSLYIHETSTQDSSNITSIIPIIELPVESNIESTVKSTVESTVESTVTPLLVNTINISSDIKQNQVNNIQTQTQKNSRIMNMNTRKGKPKNMTTRGLSGITNFGATCYMNAALQSLNVTKPFVAYMIHPESELLSHIEKRIIDEQFKKYEKEAEDKGEELLMDISMSQINEEAVEKLAYKLRLMMKRLWAHNCEVNPKQLKKYIDKHIKFFSGGFVQHDSQEFLSALIDNIHESTKTTCVFDLTFEGDAQQLNNEFLVLESALLVARTEKDIETMRSIMDKMNELYIINKDLYFQIYSKRTWSQLLKDSYSVINDIFSGMSVTTIECNTCHKSYNKFERFDLLTLHLPENVDEKKTQYSLHDLFDLYTQKEIMKDGNKYNCMYCGEKQEATKHQILYQQPNTLVLLIKKYQKYNGNIFKSNIKIEYDHELDISPYVAHGAEGDNKYELYSVIRHAGGYGGGHYYTYTKNPLNNLWYLHDDGDVYNVEPDEPLRCNGYILFYRKIT
jgi:ubiquitin C-terminal hydrolase